MSDEFESIEEARERLGEVGYLADESTALVTFLAGRLGKPVLVEGPAGVGKTELAKAVSRATGRELIRLQCYEGLDEAKALYEWNYRKQLLRIQTEAADTGWEQVQDDIFGEEFLLARPLLNAIAAEEPVVLLIDEIDKTDQEFEAMLLEVLSDFQISIPELGVVEARTQPLVLLTSNNSRELTEALKRRCLYLWLDYPNVERELEIVHLHAPELDEAIARKLVEVIHMVRALDLKKPPSIAESIDWARALLLLGAEDIDRGVLEKTMSIIVKHRTDLDLVAERVGVKLGDGVVGRAGGASSPALYGGMPQRPGPAGMAPRLLEFADELRQRGRGRRHLRAARRLPRARRGELDLALGLPRGAGRHARQVAGGPARPRRAVRPLLLPRRRARGGRAGPARGALRGRRGDRPRRAARAHPRGASAPAPTARCATSRGSRSPPSAARARAPA